MASEQTGDELQHGGFSPKNFRESDALLLGGYSVFVPHRQVRHGSGAKLSDQYMNGLPLLRRLSNVLQSVLRGEGFTMTQQHAGRY
ncbi:hypothetical protein BSU04_42420 [Caballeronia sordidicola]|uniref:Uncharacterized protein n=1 Tax=Caballeronia sordidicola TaxID=196367 RepID=A0A226WM83_CABSO|nr:hypothetical protein BSU04_42420 [Caballeronia sordidicola]